MHRAQRQSRLDIEAQFAAGLFGKIQNSFVGNPPSLVILRGNTGSRGQFVDLAAAAVNQHQPHPQPGNQGKVGGNAAEAFGLQQAAGDTDHQRFAAQIIDIRRGFAEIADKNGKGGGIHMFILQSAV